MLKVLYPCQSVVLIAVVGVYIAKSSDFLPTFLMVPTLQPMRKLFFALTSENTVDKWISSQKGFVVS